MDDPGLMGGVDGSSERGHQFGTRSSRLGRAGKSIVETAAFEQLERHEGQAVYFADIINLQDVRMPYPGDRLGLDAESGQKIRIRVAPADDHLEGNQAIQANLAGLVDDPHPSLAERLEELVAGNLREIGPAASRVVAWRGGRGTRLADRSVAFDMWFIAGVRGRFDSVRAIANRAASHGRNDVCGDLAIRDRIDYGGFDRLVIERLFVLIVGRGPTTSDQFRLGRIHVASDWKHAESREIHGVVAGLGRFRIRVTGGRRRQKRNPGRVGLTAGGQVVELILAPLAFFHMTHDLGFLARIELLIHQRLKLLIARTCAHGENPGDEPGKDRPWISSDFQN